MWRSPPPMQPVAMSNLPLPKLRVTTIKTWKMTYLPSLPPPIVPFYNSITTSTSAKKASAWSFQSMNVRVFLWRKSLISSERGAIFISVQRHNFFAFRASVCCNLNVNSCATKNKYVPPRTQNVTGTSFIHAIYGIVKTTIIRSKILVSAIFYVSFFVPVTNFSVSLCI